MSIEKTHDLRRSDHMMFPTPPITHPVNFPPAPGVNPNFRDPTINQVFNQSRYWASHEAGGTYTPDQRLGAYSHPNNWTPTPGGNWTSYKFSGDSSQPRLLASVSGNQRSGAVPVIPTPNRMGTELETMEDECDELLDRIHRETKAMRNFLEKGRGDEQVLGEFLETGRQYVSWLENKRVGVPPNVNSQPPPPHPPPVVPVQGVESGQPGQPEPVPHSGPWPFSPPPAPPVRPFSTSAVMDMYTGVAPPLHFPQHSPPVPPVLPPTPPVFPTVPPLHPVYPNLHAGYPGYGYQPVHFPVPMYYGNPTPSSSSSSSSFNMSGCMSMLSSIAVLKRKASRQVVSNWLGAVMRVLYTANLAGHVICPYNSDPLISVSPGGADPVYPPVLPPFPSDEQRYAFQRWRQLDSAAYQIVVARIDSQISDCIPPTVDGSLPTARQVMKDILLSFAPGAFVDSQKLVNDLRALTCNAKVELFLLEWTKGWIQVIRDGTMWGVSDATVHFLSKLPATFNEFKLEQTRVLDRVQDSDKNHLLGVIRLAGEREVAAGMFHTHRVPAVRSSGSSSSAPAVPCENCGIPGHLKVDCFKAGGGREGQGPPKRVRAPVANVAVEVEDVVDGGAVDPGTVGADGGDSLVDSLHDCSLYDDGVLSSVPNAHLASAFSYAYVSSDYEELQASANLANSSACNALLDSGCSHHVIRDRSSFCSYDDSSSVDIAVANSGCLVAPGRGDVPIQFA
ncbi:hypothetical protein CVT24_012278, partial [Panaeolus cyanescens]